METIAPWLALKSVPGIGNLLFKRLVDRFKSPDKVFQAPGRDLRRVNGMTERLVEKLGGKSGHWRRSES